MDEPNPCPSLGWLQNTLNFGTGVIHDTTDGIAPSLMNHHVLQRSLMRSQRQFVNLQVRFSPVYLRNEWRYFSANDHNYISTMFTWHWWQSEGHWVKGQDQVVMATEVLWTRQLLNHSSDLNQNLTDFEALEALRLW